jgi:hypothetical protein
MFIVEPSGTVKEATERLTPSFLMAVSIVTGSVALLLAVLNANIAASRIFRINITGFNPLKSFKITG